MTLPPILLLINDALLERGATALLVGGCVRDHFLQIPIKDYDIEVYGLPNLESLEEVLRRFGKVKQVGKSFGILKFVDAGKEYDFAFPRLERKVGRGHRGFDVTIDGGLDFKTAAKRRDFTINAMGYEIATHRFLDPFGGKRDLDAKLLRHIDDTTFVEDPLRVWRGVQFLARFGLHMAKETQVLCYRMVCEGMLEELPKERVFDEVKKLLLRADRPSTGLALCRELTLLRAYAPLWTLSREAWLVTLRRVDLMAAGRDRGCTAPLILMLAALTLTCGEAGSRETVALLSDEERLLTEVPKLVAHAPMIETIYRESKIDTAAADAMLRLLAAKVKIPDAVAVAKADFLARHTEMDRFEAGEWALQRAGELGVVEGPLPPLLQGRDLMHHFQLQPSPKFKEILERVYQMQIEGKITSREEALHFVEKEFL